MEGFEKTTDLRAVLTAGARHLGSLVMGAVFTAAFGVLIYSDSVFNPGEHKPTPVHQEAQPALVRIPETHTLSTLKGAYLAAGLTQAAGAEPVRVFTLTKTKKASLGEYDLTQRRDPRSLDALDPDNFTVPMPEDRTVIYLPVRGDPQNLGDTRDISGEYYTVYDENTGMTVTLNAFEITCQIVNNEIGSSWSTEVIKAQAVAAYSYVRFGYSIGITPSVGLKPDYSDKIANTVKTVQGQAIYYDGKVINSVYSASTAGYSTCSKDIWGADRPYLRCVESEYDSRDPNWDYTKTYTKEEVRSILEDKFDVTMSDDVTKWFRIDRCYSVRYVDKLTINEDPNATISGNGLCNLFGLKSNALEISFKDGVFTFKSCGWGHGVGMSQWGAKLYADQGWTYDQILRHYYINTSLRLSDPDSNAGKAPEEPQDTDSSGLDSSQADVVTSVTEPILGDDSSQTDTDVTEPPVTEVPVDTETSPIETQDTQATQDTQWTPDETYEDPGYTEY